MRDLAILIRNRPGELARMGEVLGRAGVSVEGGGAWLGDEEGIAHFLFEDATAARAALESAGFVVVRENEVLVQRLKQDVPGQLGKLTRRMSDAGVNIEALYSDHNNQLILVVDDYVRGREVTDAWNAESDARHGNPNL
ncbi:MAG: amino acid-binding ACT domain-containing protein [Gemmatimonadaceae bacterium]|nr:amino acid-binding ACT domain-containing protein [Gemmatimonadaceae bacterium]